MDEQYECISFGGGGFNTLIFIGAMYYLRRNCQLDLQKITTWHGTSAGSILAFCFCLGMTPEKILEEALDVDLGKIIHGELGEKELENLFMGRETFDGLIRGENFLNTLSEVLKRSSPDIFKEDITFLELYEKTGKKLVISGSNLTTKVSNDFDYIITPNLPILLAVLLSCSIPFIFSPFLYNGNEYVDGDFIKRKNFSSLMPNKPILRFDCTCQTRRGIFSLIKQIIFVNEKKREIEDDVFCLEYKTTEPNILKLNKKNICLLYLEGIYQTHKKITCYNVGQQLKLKSLL